MKTKELTKIIDRPVEIRADFGNGKDVDVRQQICYKSGKPCKHNCQGLCRDSY